MNGVKNNEPLPEYNKKIMSSLETLEYLGCDLPVGI